MEENISKRGEQPTWVTALPPAVEEKSLGGVGDMEAREVQ